MRLLLTVIVYIWACISLYSLSAASLAEETAIRVSVAEASEQALAHTVTATCTVAAAKKSTIAAEVPGRVIARVKEPGAQVDADDVVIEIDPERAALAVNAAQAKADSVHVRLAHARHELKRGIDLFRKRVISQDTLDDLRFAEQQAKAEARSADVNVQSLQRNLTDTRVRVPYPGQIEAVHVQEGDYVNPGQAIFTLTDFDQPRLFAGVSASEINQIQPGQIAQAAFIELGGMAITARTVNVGRVKDQQSGTFPVELRIENPTGTLREGMVGRLTWHPAANGRQLTVPSKALFRRAGKLQVYVVTGNIAELRAITIGKTNNDWVEIRSGVALGEQVVVDGLFALFDGARVAVVNQP